MFSDREDAGRLLAQELRAYAGTDAVVLAIPRGGIPVGYQIAKVLPADFDVVVTRKIPIPWEPEAGFGAVGPDGDIVLNEDLVDKLGLSSKEIRTLADGVKRELKRREATLRGDRPLPTLRSRVSVLVDDGLATGYTMIAAATWARKRGPKELVVAVPCSSAHALEAVSRIVDTVVALEVSDAPFFAVASFYREWRDLADEDVFPYLRMGYQAR